MQRIVLNFFPLATAEFTIRLYRLPYVEGDPPTIGDEVAVRRRLLVNGTYDFFWTSFEHPEGGAETVCNPFDNVYVECALPTGDFSQKFSTELSA